MASAEGAGVRVKAGGGKVFTAVYVNRFGKHASGSVIEFEGKGPRRERRPAADRSPAEGTRLTAAGGTERSPEAGLRTHSRSKPSPEAGLRTHSRSKPSPEAGLRTHSRSKPSPEAGLRTHSRSKPSPEAGLRTHSRSKPSPEAGLRTHSRSKPSPEAGLRTHSRSKPSPEAGLRTHSRSKPSPEAGLRTHSRSKPSPEAGLKSRSRSKPSPEAGLRTYSRSKRSSFNPPPLVKSPRLPLEQVETKMQSDELLTKTDTNANTSRNTNHGNADVFTFSVSANSAATSGKKNTEKPGKKKEVFRVIYKMLHENENFRIRLLNARHKSTVGADITNRMKDSPKALDDTPFGWV